MPLIVSEEMLSAHRIFFFIFIKLLEILYDDFLGWTDVHIIRDYGCDHFKHSYTLLESENEQLKKLRITICLYSCKTTLHEL